MVLLVLTLSLSTFTTSLAQTLDNHLWDQIHYEVGANSRLVELGYFPDAGGGVPGRGRRGCGPGGSQRPAELDLRAPCRSTCGTRTSPGRRAWPSSRRPSSCRATWRPVQYRGLDRVDFPTVAFWRSDFASATSARS